MTQPLEPASIDVSDGWPPVKRGMTLRRKLALLAIPTVIAVASIPVGIAHAQGAAKSHVASPPAVHLTRSATVTSIQAVAPHVAVKAATEPAEPADTGTEPAETGTDTGHSDEAAGSTTESTVDHQFDGQE